MDKNISSIQDKKYYVGLLDPKEHIFRYVISLSLAPFDWKKYTFNNRIFIENKIFNELFEKGIYTNSISCYLKIFNQSELDNFKKTEIILHLMAVYNLQLYIFDTDIVKLSDLDTTKYQYFICNLSSNKDIIFFNGFLNNSVYDLKLEDNIKKARLFNLSDAIINVDRLHQKYKGYKKGMNWCYIRNNDPILSISL